MMGQTGASAPAGLGKARIETLADGVFAIAMTLLVLDIHVPSVPAEELNAALERLLRSWRHSP